MRVQIPLLGARTVISVVGLSIAAAFGVWLLQRAPSEGIPRTLGLTLLVVALLGPILWSWYVTWGVIVLAPAASPTLRKVLIAIITFETFIGASKVDTFFVTLYRDGLLATLITVAVLFALVIIPLAPFNRWHLPALRWPASRGTASLVPATPRTD